MMSSGCTVSMCWDSEGREDRGRDRRQRVAKRGVRESRMQAARARVSMGRFACMRRVWVRDWEGERREAAQGTRFER
jgi:hypothetical protein